MFLSEEYTPLNVPIVVSAVRWEEASHGFVPSGAICGGKSFNGELIYIGRTRLQENRNELTPGVLIPSEKQLVIPFGTGVRKADEYEVLVTSDPRYVHWVPCNAGEVPINAVIGGIDCSYLEPLYIGRTRGNLTYGRTWRGQRFPGDSEVLQSNQPDYSDSTSDECSGNISQSKGEESMSLSLTNRHQSMSDCLVKSNESDDGTNKMIVSFPGKIHRTHKCLYIPYNDKEYLFREYDVLTLTTTPASLGVMCKCTIRDHLLMTMLEPNTPKMGTRRSSSMLMADTEDYVGVEKKLAQKIDLLPLPVKLKKFCKQGID
ncbi:uncharacterized protein LOC120344965 isoform X2 [Styela clava]|uniref:uncharacterized protein LOC120343922 isoform X2 n=1 Tax=Styela clava TaxID=7725 RepID=UPI00193AB14B|nr:uncharacterized protein LOC120343922 isoform X2 [Styela clava]XP_039270250.1 uncharacterized protein LOC120344965 isoform X2 [Styela clava]